ncbi:DNA helicase [Colletotrichum incanum]|nr:DNA helicase [Colletotrichum incanum]
MEVDDPFRTMAHSSSSIGFLGAKSIYERRETRCILTVNGVSQGYHDDIKVNLATYVDFATTFTYVSGPLISPEIRIDLQGTEKRGTSVITYIIARVIIPINALQGIPSIAETEKYCSIGRQASYPMLSMSVNLKRTFIAKYKKPINADLVKRSSDWMRLFIGKGESDLNIILQAPDTGSSFVDLIISTYSKEETRVVDAGLECVFKDQRISYKQLDWFTIASKLTSPPNDPIPETMVFHDDRTRMIRLQASSREDYDLEATKAELLAKSAHPCLEADDDKKYGIKPDGSYERYLVVVSVARDHKKLLPDIESPCTFTFDNTIKVTHRVPASSFPTDGRYGLQTVVGYLVDKCLEAENEIQIAVENGSLNPQSEKDRVIQIKCTMITQALEMVEMKNPQGLSSHDVALIVYQASELRDSRSMEDELAQGLGHLDPYLRPDSLACEAGTMKWKAVRTTPLSDASPDYIYFIAWVPLENSWPSHYETTPVKVDIPVLSEFKHMKNIGSFINVAQKMFRVRVHYKPEPATTQMEMGSVCLAASAKPDTDLAARWAYAQKFDFASIPKDSAVRIVNLHERFPAVGLLDFREDEKPQQELFQKLRAVPAGIAMFTGGPGSGKTTFAARIAAAVTGGGDKVMWTIHSNELCDDAVNSLKEQNVKKPDGKSMRVGRLPTWRNMKKALSQVAHAAAKRRAASKGKPTGVSTGRTVASHIDIFLSRMNQGLHERAIRIPADSVTERAVSIASADPQHYKAFWTSQPGTTEWDASCAWLISVAVDDLDILVGTPFAAGQFGRRASTTLARPVPSWKPWNPTLLVVDEAGRIPEAQWWIPLSAFPDACVLTMGDTRQFKPLAMSVSEGRHRDNVKISHLRTDVLDWRCVFGMQRTVSLLRRAETNNQILGNLSSNRRNRGDIANWAKKHIYPGEMRIIYPLLQDRSAQIYLHFMKWIFSGDDVSSNSVAIDVRYTESCKHNLSSINPGNRNFVWWIVYMAFQYKLPNLRSKGKLADIMIMTPYGAQHGGYKDEIIQMEDSGVIKRKITLRTIDNAMSAEADLVIFDSVRTGGGIGFLEDQERMATKKERGDSIDNPFASYILSHKTRFASKKAWRNVCESCNSPDDHSGPCPRARRCAACRGPHHERFCVMGKPAEDRYVKDGNGEMEAADGVALPWV